MNPALRAHAASFHLRFGPYDEQDVGVLRFRSTEGLSRLFELRVELASREPNLDFEAVVGKPASFRLTGGEGERYLHGVVAEFRQGGRSRHHYFYEAVVRPSIWMLTQRENCRIFQGHAVDEIIAKILEEHGLAPGSDFEFALAGSYRKRGYCVQYNESDLDFVARLLEEEGIHYAFQSDSESSRVVFGDTGSAHVALPGRAQLRLAPPDGMVATDGEEQITSLEFAQFVRSGSVVLNDYQFKKPRLNLFAAEKAERHADLEVFAFPGAYTEPKRGQQFARIRLEEVQARRKELRGESNCVRLAPGRTFVLVEHAREEFNRGYIVTEVEQVGASPQSLEEDVALGGEGRYSNRFVAIPDDVPYRPARVTPRPIVKGTQTAVVVGPAGEEIYTDDHGRVKVQFFWDRYGRRDQESSCWIRCSQPWAGAGWGGLAIPRIGQEVVIDFLEGNPDRPLIVGRVYNGDVRPPQSLPAGKANMTIRSQSLGGSGGSNEITMGDSGGEEGFYMHAQYDMTEVVENDHTSTINNNETTTIAVDRTESVGNNETIQIGVNRTESVGADETVTIGGNRKHSVSGDAALEVGGKERTKVGGSQSLEVGSNQSVNVAGMANEIVGMAKATNVGAAYAITVGAALNIAVGGVSLEEVGLVKKIYAGNSVEIACGGASIKLESSGKVTIKGTDIAIEGSGAVVIKGSTIDLN